MTLRPVPTPPDHKRPTNREFRMYRTGIRADSTARHREALRIAWAVSLLNPKNYETR